MKKIVSILIVLVGLVLVAYLIWGGSGEAPLNDSQDGSIGAEKELTAQSLAGAWRSLNDSGFVREFSASGMLVDHYGGGETASKEGEWTLVSDSSQESASLPKAEGADGIIKVMFSGESDPHYYAVAQAASGKELAMVPLDNGGAEVFERVEN